MDNNELSTNLAEVGTDAVSRKAVKELAYSQIRSMYCGVALKEQRETMLRIADNVIDLLAPVASTQPEIIHCGECTKMKVDSVFHDCWCSETGKKVWVNHYCGYADRREERR